MSDFDWNTIQIQNINNLYCFGLGRPRIFQIVIFFRYVIKKKQGYREIHQNHYFIILLFHWITFTHTFFSEISQLLHVSYENKAIESNQIWWSEHCFVGQGACLKELGTRSWMLEIFLVVSLIRYIKLNIFIRYRW